MSNIIGDQAMVKWGKEFSMATPGNKVVFINWEAIDELPPQYETVVTTLRFDLKKDFTEISKKFMPTTDFSYKIAEACGISGCETSEIKTIYENVDINRMLCKSMFEAPEYREIKVGVQVTKRSQRLMEDGSFLYSSPCTQIYNVWDRCNEDWAKEEKYTNEYANKPKFGNAKYQKPSDRKYQFFSEMKFAQQKAESKAYCKTIRELASLPTAFESVDLSAGVLMFSKVRISKKALALEQAARLSGIANKQVESNALLFGDTEPEEPIKQVEEQAAVVTNEIALLDLLESYKALVGENKALAGMINWLKDGNDYTSDANANFYSKIVANIKDIESRLDKDQLIPHNYR